MNWFSKLVPPKIKSLIKTDVPDNLWIKCNSCEQMIFHKDIENNLYTCKFCEYHFKMPIEARLESLFDHGTFHKLTHPSVVTDPLNFKDTKKYTDRLKAAKQSSKYEEAIVSAIGTIGSCQCVVSVLNFDFIGGSMGTFMGEEIVKSAEYAITNKVPYIIVTASGGARMQEGILSLMQMPRTAMYVKKLKDNKIPYIVILTNPTTGGVSASFGMLGDIHIAEKGALIGFAGPRVIKGTIKQELPENFQTAEYLLEHGMVDIVVNRKELRNTLEKILKSIKSNHMGKKTRKSN